MAEIEKEVWINTEDPHLSPIRVDILELIQRTYKEFGLKAPKDFPNKNSMGNFEKRKAYQIFTPEIYPQRLKDLEFEIRQSLRSDKSGFDRKEQMVINTFWEQLNLRAEDYQTEIAWIKMAWYHRLFGYWFYCNGTPTYMTGVNWFYLNFWYLDDVKPEYRDSDRRWFIAQKWLQLDTYTFKYVDKETGQPIKTNGKYEMLDTGRKVWVGSNNPKARRRGHTSKAQCDNCEFSTRTREAHIGIQGKDEDNAENVFKNHFLRPYKKLPIVFKPISAQINPNQIMIFENDDGLIEGLNTRVDYATTKHRSAYDGY